MNPIGLKQAIRMKIYRLLHIDRSKEYGLMAKTAYLAPDSIVFNKKNLFMYENTGIPGGGNDS